MIQNFLTLKQNKRGMLPVLILISLLVTGTTIYLNGLIGSESWMAADYQSVFKQQQFWKLWTTLFAHGDMPHLLSNLFLFIPFAYFFTNTFSLILFPFMGFFMGGIINLFVLTTLPPQTGLIGVSGVVYWMGACWITLSFLIDLRENLYRRLIKSTAIALILFTPEAFRPEVSHLSHFAGALTGFLSGVIYYLLFRKFIRAADRYEYFPEQDEPGFDEEFSASSQSVTENSESHQKH